MRDFLEEVLIPFALIAGFCFAGLAVLCGVVAAINKVECANLNEVTKRKTDFRWIGGCYVEHEGEMLPYDRWKLLEVRHKERK